MVSPIAQADEALECRDREIERLRAENERLKAFIADRIHDATREEMMMQLED